MALSQLVMNHKWPMLMRQSLDEISMVTTNVKRLMCFKNETMSSEYYFELIL
jgi:hypothetical protein